MATTSRLSDLLGFTPFTDPQDILYASIFNDDLTKLESLLTSPPNLASDINTVVVPRFDTGDLQASEGWGTPLHFAAWLGNVDAVKILLAAGADPKLIASISLGEGFDASALYLAILEGHRAVVKTLWDFAGPVLSEIEDSRKPIDYAYPCIAARAGHASVLQDLLKWRSWNQDVKKKSLELASGCWQLHAVIELLRLVSYDQDDLDKALQSAAAWRKEYEGELYADLTAVECIRQQVLVDHLITAGANPNCRRNGGVPLIVDAAACDPEMTGCLRVLLERGLDPNASDFNGDTALHELTCGNHEGDGLTTSIYEWNRTSIHMLLDHNADACLANDQGITAVQLAAQYAPDPYDLNYLLSNGLALGRPIKELSTISNESLLHFAALGGRRDTMEFLLSSHGMDVDLKTHSGWTPLMYALLPKPHRPNPSGWSTLKSSVRAARYLLDRGANPLITTDEGWTPLHALSLHDDADQSGFAKSLALDLIRHGAPINPSAPALAPLHKSHAISDRLRNPIVPYQWLKLPLLHWAAQHGAVHVVKALIESGANVYEKDEYGNTAAEVAREFEIFPLLKRDQSYEFGKTTEEMVVEVLDQASVGVKEE